MLKIKQYIIRKYLVRYFLYKISFAQKSRTNINTFPYETFIIFQKRRNICVKHVININIYTYRDRWVFLHQCSVHAQEMLRLDCMVTSTHVIWWNLTMLSVRLIFRARIKYGEDVVSKEISTEVRIHQRAVNRVTHRCSALYGIDIIIAAAKSEEREMISFF